MALANGGGVMAGRQVSGEPLAGAASADGHRERAWAKEMAVWPAMGFLRGRRPRGVAGAEIRSCALVAALRNNGERNTSGGRGNVQSRYWAARGAIVAGAGEGSMYLDQGVAACAWWWPWAMARGR